MNKPTALLRTNRPNRPLKSPSILICIAALTAAFFLSACAGTKAILVSMWPVETTSARKLTTGVFHNQKLDPTLSRSRALQMAAVDLMDNESMIEASTGKKIASYAHPLFWAPFIIVGEEGW